MAKSKQIAALAGPVLIAVTLSEMLNPHIWAAVSAPITYQSGTLLFVAGLSIIRVHNVWSYNWPVLVTAVGWFSVVTGLARMFAPELSQQAVENKYVPLGLQLVLLLGGFVLTYKAYVADDAARPGN